MADETPEQKAARAALEKNCQAIGQSLNDQLPEDVGFVFFLFRGGSVSVVSNVGDWDGQEPVLDAMKNWTRRTEAMNAIAKDEKRRGAGLLVMPEKQAEED